MSHLTFEDRHTIELKLSEKCTPQEIARILNRSPATIVREITRHMQVKKTHTNDCLNSGKCTKRKVCGSTSCNGICRRCNKCRKHCNDYVQSYCEKLCKKKTAVCNGCSTQTYCNYEKRFYKAKEAQISYQQMLTDSRNGFDLTLEEIITINDLVSPLIRKGQSPYHIKQSLGDKLPVSEATLRRMIDNGELDVRNIDLKEKVKRRERKRPNKTMHRELQIAKIGHTYKDFLEYISENDTMIVEMDCVEGTKEDEKVILTLYFRSLHMQLYFIMPQHTSACVVETLDIIEEAIGTELFRNAFPVILGDNGHEFSDISGMERSISGGQRTKVYFCEPNRSDQKGGCENNHKLLRNIIPKGTSLERFDQMDISLCTNHVNSYCRKSLFGKCPYDMALSVLPEDFFILLGLEQITAGEVVLHPSLLREKNSVKVNAI